MDEGNERRVGNILPRKKEGKKWRSSSYPRFRATVGQLSAAPLPPLGVIMRGEGGGSQE